MRALARHVPFIALTVASLALAACGPATATPSPVETEPGDEPSPSTSTQDAAEIGRAFVEALATGDTAGAEAVEDATMRSAAPAAALATLWSQIEGQFGAYQGIGEVTTAPSGAYQNATIETRFDLAMVPLIVSVSGAGEVAGIHLGQPRPVASGEPAASPTGSPGAAGNAGSPPAYVDPASFTETEVTVGQEPWALPGTLTMPVGDGPFPAVVLVAGSGPNDRDETIGPNKPLRDLAWGLASEGIAVLRYEKRTRIHGAAIMADPDGVTVDEETVDDAVAAVDLLRSTAGIDPDRVAVAGHSLGGYLAPRIASRAPDRIAGIAVLEGNVSPLERMLEDQLTYLASEEGGADPQAAAMLAALPAQLEALRSPNLSASTPATSLPLGVPASYWLDLRDYDPGAIAADLDVPMLIVQGGRDYQVPPSELALWREALDGRAGVTVREYPALNHLLMAGEGPSRSAEYAVPGHVDAAVVAGLADWLAALPGSGG